MTKDFFSCKSGCYLSSVFRANPVSAVSAISAFAVMKYDACFICTCSFFNHDFTAREQWLVPCLLSLLRPVNPVYDAPTSWVLLTEMHA